jgi:Ser/Thr protein kinase RdoA (MazF antagonist)
MLPSAPHEARWTRGEPRRTLPPEILDRMVRTAFPRRRVVEMQPLGDGLRNANFKLRLDGQPEPVVLRIYEHDASLCRKEMDLLRLAGGALPRDWRRLARVLDLAAVCESLTHHQLPDTAIAKLVELVRATAENRDPESR